MRKEIDWDEVVHLKPGEHVHLDKCLADPPGPGAREWFFFVERIIENLVEQSGAWLIRIPLGTITQVPIQEPTIKSIYSVVSTQDLYEPPSIYRLGDPSARQHFQGEVHKWSRIRHQPVTEEIQFARSVAEAEAGASFDVVVTYFIRPG